MYNLIVIHTSLSLFCTYDRRKRNSCLSLCAPNRRFKSRYKRSTDTSPW